MVGYAQGVRKQFPYLQLDRTCPMGESSAPIRARVQAARDIQRNRFTNSQSPNHKLTDIICNADMRVGEIGQFCRLQACPEQGRRDEG